VTWRVILVRQLNDWPAASACEAATYSDSARQAAVYAWAAGWQNCPSPQLIEPPMQLKTALLFATPCDEEEENMATLCCSCDGGHMFLMTRYPDEDSIDLTLGEEFSTLGTLKITLGPRRLLVEVAASDRDALKGHATLEILHQTPEGDLRGEVELALRKIVDGIGTLVIEA